MSPVHNRASNPNAISPGQADPRDADPRGHQRDRRRPAAGAPHSDLTLWVFRGDQAEIDRELRPGFGRETGKSFRVDLIGSTAINMRLHSLFLSGRRGAPLPDATEIEIGGVGAYLRPPVDEVGFLPLNDLLARSGCAKFSLSKTQASPDGTPVSPVTAGFIHSMEEIGS